MLQCQVRWSVFILARTGFSCSRFLGKSFGKFKTYQIASFLSVFGSLSSFLCCAHRRLHWRILHPFEHVDKCWSARFGHVFSLPGQLGGGFAWFVDWLFNFSKLIILLFFILFRVDWVRLFVVNRWKSFMVLKSHCVTLTETLAGCTAMTLITLSSMRINAVPAINSRSLVTTPRTSTTGGSSNDQTEPIWW